MGNSKRNAAKSWGNEDSTITPFLFRKNKYWLFFSCSRTLLSLWCCYIIYTLIQLFVYFMLKKYIFSTHNDVIFIANAVKFDCARHKCLRVNEILLKLDRVSKYRIHIYDQYKLNPFKEVQENKTALSRT